MWIFSLVIICIFPTGVKSTVSIVPFVKLARASDCRTIQTLHVYYTVARESTSDWGKCSAGHKKERIRRGKFATERKEEKKDEPNDENVNRGDAKRDGWTKS